MEAYDDRGRTWLLGTLMVCLLWLGLRIAPGFWRHVASAGMLVTRGFARGVAGAILLLLHPLTVLQRTGAPR